MCKCFDVYFIIEFIVRVMITFEEEFVESTNSKDPS